jgi:hypothetical protein
MIDFQTDQLEDGHFQTIIKKKGVFICKATGESGKMSKERACFKACKILGYID